MTTVPDADLIEMLRAAYPSLEGIPDLDVIELAAWTSRIDVGQWRAILAWANARRDAAELEVEITLQEECERRLAECAITIGRLKAALRVNALRYEPKLSHAEIDAEIARIVGDETPDQRDATIARLTAEIEDLRSSVIAFGAPGARAVLGPQTEGGNG